MKKAEIFFDAITNIREDLIEEALEYQFKHAVLWRRYLRTAACLALVVLVGFGALRLGLFGGMGGSDSAANNTAADMIAGDRAPTAPESGNAAPESPALPSAGKQEQDDAPADGAPLAAFTATVLEVHDNYLLVKPEEDTNEAASADRIHVPTGELRELPSLEVGDCVHILYSGHILETYPAQLTEVVEITLQE